jgi:hypothetical protein
MHSILSASGASRWWNCPGNIGATRAYIDSAYSAEPGTPDGAALLTTGRDAVWLIGTTIRRHHGHPQWRPTCGSTSTSAARVIDASDIRYVEHPS